MRACQLGCVVVLSHLVGVPAASAQIPDRSLSRDIDTADHADGRAVTLAYVEGHVDLVRSDGVVQASAPDFIDEDERLVTGDGRAELVLSDGSVVHVAPHSDLRVDLGGRLRVVRGRVVVHVPEDIANLELGTPAGPARLGAPGVYDLSADDLAGDTVVTVIDGSAVIGIGADEHVVGVGDVIRLNPRDRRPRWARASPADAFVDWARHRMTTTTAATAPPLPTSVQPWAGELAAHGRWGAVDPYGPVWFPAAGPAWRPYQYGTWRFTRRGWTWIDADRWAWPVHHYGRWGHMESRGWFWVPAATWGPSWVAWAIATDHVAWSPLGWNGAPLVDFTYGVRRGPVGLFANAWSILPRHAFGRRGSIHRELQDPRALPGPVLGGFVSQLIAPRGPAGADDLYSAERRRRPARAYDRPSREAPPPGRGRPLDAPPRRTDEYPPGVGYGEAAPESREPARGAVRRPTDAPPPPAAGVVAPAPGPRSPGRPVGVPPTEWARPRGGPPPQPVGAPVRVPRGGATAPAPDAPAPEGDVGAPRPTGGVRRPTSPQDGAARPRGGDRPADGTSPGAGPAAEPRRRPSGGVRRPG